MERKFPKKTFYTFFFILSLILVIIVYFNADDDEKITSVIFLALGMIVVFYIFYLKIQKDEKELYIKQEGLRLFELGINNEESGNYFYALINYKKSANLWYDGAAKKFVTIYRLLGYHKYPLDDDFFEYIKYCKILAKDTTNPDSECQYWLAMHYYESKRIVDAEGLFRRSAKQGNVLAENFITNNIFNYSEDIMIKKPWKTSH